MADSGLVKWVKEEENNQLGHLLQQYKYDVEGEWNRYPHEFLHEFADLCGKKLPSVDGTDGSEGMMGKVHNRKASESLRRPISFFKVPHAAIVDNMRTALQI